MDDDIPTQVEQNMTYFAELSSLQLPSCAIDTVLLKSTKERKTFFKWSTSSTVQNSYIRPSEGFVQSCAEFAAGGKGKEPEGVTPPESKKRKTDGDQPSFSSCSFTGCTFILKGDENEAPESKPSTEGLLCFA